MSMKSIIPWKKEEPQVGRRPDGDPFLSLHRRMNSLFDEFFSHSYSDLWGGFGTTFEPRVDVSETGKEIRVAAELPGLDEKDIDVEVTGNLLTIKGEKKDEEKEEKADYWHSERHYGFFERSIELPEGIDSGKAHGQFKKGVLKIAIPKKPEAQSSSRKIELFKN